jgi:hypothetical protein
MIVKHSIRVIGRYISHPFGDTFVASNVDTDVLEVTFDADWENMDVMRAVFVNSETSIGLSLDTQSLTQDVEVPHEVLRNPGRLFVTFVGYKGDARLVTACMEKPYCVKPSGRVIGWSPNAPTKDEITQLMLAVGVSTNRANEAAASATSAAATALSAADNANTAADRANTAAEAAQEVCDNVSVYRAISDSDIKNLFK